MKESVLFDMKSETCLLLLVEIIWKCEYFIFLAKCFLLLYALGFHACIFWPLGWLWLKTILSVSDFLETFPCNSSLLISGWKELDSSMVEFLWFI